MLLAWPFHFQLFSLDCVAVIQMGWVYAGDEHLVVHVIFVLQLQLDKFHFFLQGFVFLLFSKVLFFPDQDLFNIFHFALTVLDAGSDFIDVAFVQNLLVLSFLFNMLNWLFIPFGYLKFPLVKLFNVILHIFFPFFPKFFLLFLRAFHFMKMFLVDFNNLLLLLFHLFLCIIQSLVQILDVLLKLADISFEIIDVTQISVSVFFHFLLKFFIDFFLCMLLAS